MGNSCFSKQTGASPAASTGDGAKSKAKPGPSNGRRRTRDRVRKGVRGRKRGSSASLGSPRLTELSISSETVYFDAHDTVSEDGHHGRLTRGSSYQDGIDDYPTSPSVAPDEDTLLQPDELPPTCLPRILSHKESKTFVRLTRPPAGQSLKRSNLSPPPMEDAAVPEGAPAPGASLLRSPSGHVPPVDRHEDPPGDKFLVRGADYLKTKKKVPSANAFYRLLDVDLYSFDFRLGHIAKHVQLPPLPALGDQSHLPREQRLPPLLIVNIQLPEYPASIFGRNDGPGCSLVMYFGLPEGWTPEQEPNKAAMGLLQRFVNGGKEADGCPTRDRLKLIPRVVNVDEWATTAPLSGTEQTLLRRYNDKPLLTRPQQRFFLTPEYLEVDLDVHNYAYIARKAFLGFYDRLNTVVFDNAFVVQGNKAEELPEQVFAAARLHYPDLGKVRPFPADLLERINAADGSSDSDSG